MPEEPRDLRTRVVEPIRPVQLVAGIFVVGMVVISDTLADTAIRGARVPSTAIAGDLLRLTPSANQGIALGLLSDAGPAVVILLTGLALAVAFASVRRVRGTLFRAAIWLLLGGGVANLIERVAHGRVLDYVDLGLGNARWPTFNLADVAISLAVVAVAAGIAAERLRRTVGGASGTERP